MKTEKRKSEPENAKNTPRRRTLAGTLTLTATLAALGTSLGVDVRTLFAAETKQEEGNLAPAGSVQIKQPPAAVQGKLKQAPAAVQDKMKGTPVAVQGKLKGTPPAVQDKMKGTPPALQIKDGVSNPVPTGSKPPGTEIPGR